MWVANPNLYLRVGILRVHALSFSIANRAKSLHLRPLDHLFNNISLYE